MRFAVLTAFALLVGSVTVLPAIVSAADDAPVFNPIVPKPDPRTGQLVNCYGTFIVAVVPSKPIPIPIVVTGRCTGLFEDCLAKSVDGKLSCDIDEEEECEGVPCYP